MIFSCKENFHENHWDTVDNDSFIEAGECGTCHKEQYESWKTSLHSRSVGSGFLWQMPAMSEVERKSCYRCHSPNTKNINQPSITCSNCHLRDNRIYAPPKKIGESSDGESIHANNKHGNDSDIGIKYLKDQPGYHEVIRTKEMEDSKFCKNCHETPRAGKMVIGKYLMDVYKDWENSQFSKTNTHCQNCHMPNREHSWKGIHNKEFVKNSVGIHTKLGNNNTIQLRISNDHIGHKFPAYSVPRIIVQIFQGKNLIKKDTIGWELDIFLEKEAYDTRINPGDQITRIYNLDDLNPDHKKEFKIEIWIAPRYHYGKIFKYVYETEENLSEYERYHIENAMREEKNSWYLIYEKYFQ